MAVKGDTYPKPHDFERWFIELGGERKALADHYGVTSQTVRERWIPEMELRSFDSADLPKGRPAEMLRERDLDPELWQVVSLKVNEWEVTSTDEEGNPTTSTNVQTSLNCAPQTNILRAARPDGWKPPKTKPHKASNTGTDFIVGDHQAPYHDAPMHRAVVNWLGEVQPRQIVHLGDGVDLPSVSKYAKKVGWHAAINECVDAFYRILCDYRSASPDSKITYLFGNHEKRLWDALARDFAEGAEIRRAGEGAPVLSLAYLLRLDELSVDFMDNYPHDVYKLAEDTAVFHGNKSKSGASSVGKAEVQNRRYNLFHGHDHTQAINAYTHHDIDGNVTTTYGVSVGASCQVVGGLGYAVRPDWQTGCATATFDKDGDMTPELLNWTNKKLNWRGKSWR